MMAERIIDGLEHTQSVMKSIFASLIVASLAVSATAKDRHCVFRVHAEANPHDTAAFSSSVRALYSGKQVAIERMPRLSDRDVVAFYPYDAGNGKLLWERTAYEGKVFDDIHRFNTYASPTPVTDGKFVYVWFESQGLYKYDFDGKLVWTASLGGIASLGVGTGGSPVLFEDLILLLCDQDEGKDSFLAAVSTRDGKVAWKLNRKNAITWTTPALVESGGRKLLIVPSTEDVVAYDPRSGKELWRAEGLGGTVVHTPVTGHGMVYVSTGYPTKKTMGIRLDPAPGEARVAWKYEKGTGYIPSPILYGDHVYLMTGAGLLTCLDAHTGEPRYEAKRFPTPGQFVASPVAFDGKVLITSQDGDTYVVKAGPVHEIIGTNPLGEQIFASLALVGDSIYMRAEKHLYRIRASS